MSRCLLYLAGPPAAGKSTLMRALTFGCHRLDRTDPIGHTVLVDPVGGAALGAELGRDRPRFPGTDTLPMGVAPAAAAFVRSGLGPALLLAEGDRLAHLSFLAAAEIGGYRVTLGLLEAPLAELDRRCQARGSTQNEAWRRGRATKAARLADAAAALGHQVLRLDGTAPPVDNARRLLAAVPALSVLPAIP